MAGGFELRNRYFKGCVAPKSISSIQSEKGGRYIMTVHYIGRPYSRLEINVNNDKTQLFNELETEKGKRASLTFYIELQPGFNYLRMGSSYCWAPDLDCFTLSPAMIK